MSNALIFIPKVWDNIAIEFDASSNVENLLNTAAASFMSIPILVIYAAVSFNLSSEIVPKSTMSFLNAMKFLLKFLGSKLYFSATFLVAEYACSILAFNGITALYASIARYFMSSAEYPAAFWSLTKYR